MEENKIVMNIEVKMEINDKKPEVAAFKHWTKCTVQMEAVKCIPCFIRITLFKIKVCDEYHNIFEKEIQPINIKHNTIACNNSHSYSFSIHMQNIIIRSAASRTKKFSYGLFWKQNRQKCCIFFAFKTKISYEFHMKWIRRTLKSLDCHRKEVFKPDEKSENNGEGTSKSEENDRSENGLQFILGPLPKTPTFFKRMDFKHSDLSDIYEEITDFQQMQQQEQSVESASGIYEVIDSDFELIGELTPPPAPPLPRRLKKNSKNDVCKTTTSNDNVIPRCFTNPESEVARKKRYLTLFGTVFGRSKRCSSVSERKIISKTDLINEIRNHNDHYLSGKDKSNIEKIINKQNYKEKKYERFCVSTPNLKDFNYLNESEVTHIDECITTLNLNEIKNKHEIDTTKNDSFLISMKNETDQIIEANDALDISEQIQSNFNFSCNSSTINVVGSNSNETTQLHDDKKQSQNISVVCDDFSGYCYMAPIKKKTIRFSDAEEKISNNLTNSSDMNVLCSKLNIVQQEHQPLKKYNILEDDLTGYCIMTPIIFDDNKENNAENSIVINQKYPNDNKSAIYENMQLIYNEEISMNKKTANENEVTDKSVFENIYQNLPINEKKEEQNNDKQETEEILPNIQCSSMSLEQVNITSNSPKLLTKRRYINFDEKMPSYYPNDSDILNASITSSNSSDDVNYTSCDVMCCQKKSSPNAKSKNNIEDFVITSPQKIKHKRKNNLKSIKKHNDEIHHHNHLFHRNLKSSKKIEKFVYSTLSSPPAPPSSPTSSLSPSSPASFKYFETEENVISTLSSKFETNSGNSSSFKFMSTLPRLKKIDLSPLRLRINSVWQKNQ